MVYQGSTRMKITNWSDIKVKKRKEKMKHDDWVPDCSQQLRLLYFVDSVLLGEAAQNHQFWLQSRKETTVIPFPFKDNKKEKKKEKKKKIMYENQIFD